MTKIYLPRPFRLFFLILVPLSFTYGQTGTPCQIICPANLTFDLGSGECGKVVTYQVSVTGDCQATLPVQTAGLPSAAMFPIGVTQNCFTLDLPPFGSPDGDTTCCFDITVVEFPNPVANLVCDDLTLISIDEDCQLCIGAGLILEAGPYRCFDKYLVELDKTAPLGNGPWVSACVGAADIGKTFQVRITEPAFGNKCWGTVIIEDKLPPVLKCRDLELPCNANLAVGAAPWPAAVENHALTQASLSDTIGATGSQSPDVHTYSFDFNFLPSGATVLDVNCRIKLSGHTRLSDLDMVVTAPGGAQADLFTTDSCSGAEWPIDLLFDDEGTGNLNSCDQLNAGGAALQGIISSASAPNVLQIFDGKNARGTWTVTISDSIDDEDGLIEELGLEIQVNMPAMPAIDNCSPVTLTHTDNIMVSNCASGYTQIVNRLWRATDAYFNSSTCIQQIKLKRPVLADVVLPPDYDGISADAIPCTAHAYPSADWLEAQQLQGFPEVFGLPNGCNINWTYADVVISVCPGSYKIRREWTIIDWCSGEVITHNQIIKVTDNQGPIINCPANMTVSTDPFGCCATMSLPDVVVADQCSGIQQVSGTVAIFDPTTGNQTGIENFSASLTDFPGNDWSNPDTLGNFSQTACIPVGAQVVRYLVEDGCGNTATCSFQLAVQDYVPPVAVCDEMTTIAIGVDDLSDCYGPAGPNGQPPALGACEFAGVTWVKAAAFDDGTYDGCNNFFLTIRRLPPYSDCVLGLNATNGHLPCTDLFPDFPSEFERAISEMDSIKFYACEAGTTIQLGLRAYQLNSDSSFSIGPNGIPIYNECIIEVAVTDKIKPVCAPPANVTVACAAFDPSLLGYGKATIADNCCLDESKTYQGQCGLAHTVNYAEFDSLCNKGTILRTFEAFDCHGNTSKCTQRIAVNYAQDYFVRFPDDVIVTACPQGNEYGEPSFFGEDCELLAISYEDAIIDVFPDACYRIERNWSVINWCSYNPTLPLVNVPNPNPSAILNHPSNLPGPTVAACAAPSPWNPTIVKISPSDTAATDYCTFWSASTNGYRYKQHIKIIDMAMPVISNCPAGLTVVADSTNNDPALWSSLPAIQDLSETTVNLGITSSDDCAGGHVDASFLLFLDLDQDGSQETVVDSRNLPGADTIRYNNANTPGYLGGTPVTFDSRPVPASQKWHFALQQNNGAGSASAAVRWNTALAPTAFVTPQLPQGTHKIKWVVSDHCGNESVCEHSFTIEQGPVSGIDPLDAKGFALYQNEPNPFSSKTSISFRLPVAAEASLKVYDTEGRLLFEKTGAYAEGLNTIAFEGTWLQGPALLYYQVQSGVHTAWRKMVLVR